MGVEEKEDAGVWVIVCVENISTLIERIPVIMFSDCGGPFENSQKLKILIVILIGAFFRKDFL